MKIAAIAGSLRKDSYNKKLLINALSFLKDQDVDLIDLKSLALPVYDFDMQVAGFPNAVNELSTRIKSADALVIATPEYNHGIPGGLKNAIDWISRSPEKPLHNKTAFIMGASTGGFGAIRGIYALRQTLVIFNIITIPQSVMLSFADKAFDENGKLKDEKILAQLKTGCEEMVRITRALKR
ncbi:NAD(P)H-dependent oxidoreductase [bacterium]|nr:MAG: NAD(P)H-dependent oxidoreductase [bacterium]